MTDPYTILSITCPDAACAREIGRALVEARLAACVNIIPAITSLYEWQGKMEETSEVLVLAKTRASCVQSATDRVLAMHPYDCPCVTAWPINGGNPAFLEWIGQQTRTCSSPLDH